MKKKIYPITTLLLSSLTIVNCSSINKADAIGDPGEFVYSTEIVDLINNGQTSYKLSGSFTNGTIITYPKLNLTIFFRESGKDVDDYDDATIVYENRRVNRGETITFKNVDVPRIKTTKKGIVARIECMSGGKIVSWVEFLIGKKKKDIIKINELNDKVIRYENCYLKDGTMVPEIYTFDNYTPTLTMMTYHRFNLSEYYFDYHGPLYLSGEAYLEFDDPNELFPTISKQNGKRHIPCELVREDKRYYLQFKDLYVNRYNLDMASGLASSNYVKTPYIYLPRNNKAKLEKYVFTIVGKKLGMNEIEVSYDFSLDTKTLLLGPCNSAEYCIIGELK